jgi:hypothetical protein
MRTARPLASCAVAVSLALAPSACKRASERAEERAIEQQTGDQVRVDSEKQTVTVGNDAGSLVSSLGSKVPDDFPKVVPIYPGGKPMIAAKSSNPQGKPAWSVTLETDDTKDKVVAYYKANMSGLKLASDMDMGQTDMSIWQSPQYDVTLMVSEADQKTTIIVSATGK